MSQVLKERLKNIVILILIMIGALQVGILWSYQNHGTPINFIMSFFGSPSVVSGEYTKEKLFVPDRLILSSGDIYYWTVGRNSSYYNELWREAQKGLGKIISRNVGLKQSNESWGDITAKRGFILDFGYSLKPELLKWFLGVSGKTRDLPEISKVMVKPDLLDESSNIYYIYAADGRVYVSDPIIYERSKSLKDILKHFNEDNGKNYRSLVTFKSANVVIGRNVPDVLYATASYGKYYTYSGKLPAENNDELETALLGSEKNRYDMSEDSSGTKQFSSGNNIYRYYKNGYMTYQYTDSSVSSDKGDIGEALVNAYNLINEFKVLSGPLAEFYLTSASETSEGVYSFTFDYRLNGLPVKINLSENSADGKSLTNAVKIQADSKRVLSCTAILRDFVQGAEGNYNDQFFDLLKKTDYAFKSMKIQDMHFGYLVHSEGNIALKPSILVDVNGKPTIQIEMSEKGE